MSDEVCSLEIPRRFNGPPMSGNGGYVCGALAASLTGADAADRIGNADAPAVRVRLHRPPPLEKPLRIVRAAEGVRLLDADTLLAEAWPSQLDLEPPAAPDFDDATRAARGYRGFEEHVFPSCFVCGPEREWGDGLRLFPGPLAGTNAAASVATPWIPDPSLATADGAGGSREETRARVDPVFVWAALDCPGCFSFPQPEDAALLLGELCVRIDAPVRVGDRCVVVGWSLDHEGRKHTTGTALYDATGRCCGVGRATWIEVPLSSFRPSRRSSRGACRDQRAS